jgi:hypothetical protein
MPVLVHIADEKNAARILKSGIKPDKRRKVVYCMPVLQDFYITHQWLRELKRFHSKVLVGVYFRLPSRELVWAGKYNEEHHHISLGDAIHEIEVLPDPLGYELFLERKVEAAEIVKIRHLPQKTGWRYYPAAHGKAPCGCPWCTRAQYGGKRIREKYDPPPPKVYFEDIKRVILESDEVNLISDALRSLFVKRRWRSDPAFLERIYQLGSDDLLGILASILERFKHKNTLRMLTRLCGHPNPEVREAAAESAYLLYKQNARELLGPGASDPVVAEALTKIQARMTKPSQDSINS